MSFTVIIPVRLQSTRLPGKVLLPIAGKPMLAHVIDRAKESGAARVIVSSGDQEILSLADTEQVEACQTKVDHPTGTDRIVETAQTLALADNEIIVGLQGDEPLLPGILIDQVAKAVNKQTKARVATLSIPIKTLEDYQNPHVVKVVTDKQHYACYFSRATIPYTKAPTDLSLMHRHIGLYAYRAGFLKDFCRWPEAPIEQLEKLEQLRMLWHGESIYVEQAQQSPGHGVDTSEDLERVRQLLV